MGSSKTLRTLSRWARRFGMWMVGRWWRTLLVATVAVAGSAHTAWLIVRAGVDFGAAPLASVDAQTRVHFMVVVCVVAALALLLKYLNKFFYGCIEIGCALAGARYVLAKGDQTPEALFVALMAIVYVLVRGAENCIAEAKEARAVHRGLTNMALARQRLLESEAYFEQSSRDWLHDRERIAETEAKIVAYEAKVAGMRAAMRDGLIAPDREAIERVEDALREVAQVEQEIEEAKTQLVVLTGRCVGMHFRVRENLAEIRGSLDERL
jgi:hypothetical protein